MHEMAITQEIIELCEKHAGGRSVQVVTVEIGLLSGVVPEAIEFCFAACAADTLAAAAHLIIKQIPGQASCLACNHQQVLKQLYDPCSICGSYEITVTAGQEMRVREIEVAD